MGQDGKSYAKQIYKQIKTDILELNIRDGDFLTLSELANKYNVSKTPVRDALGELETEGYLTSLPRKGYLVKPLTSKNIRESFQMRIIFEVAAVKLVIENADDSDLKNIYNIAEKFSKSINNKANEKFNKLNNLFHMTIIQSTHNSLLIEIYGNIMDNLSRILLMDNQDNGLTNQKEEHIEIAKALLERNCKKAEKLILKHILKSEKKVNHF